MRRAGLDYHDMAAVTVHTDLEALQGAFPHARVYAFTARAATVHSDVSYGPQDILLFGPEPTGLPAHVLDDARLTDRVRIPMIPGARSMNLSNSAAVAAYEAWRQLGYPGGT